MRWVRVPRPERRPMAASASRGPLDPPPDGREAALAARWRRLRPGLPSAIYLLACAVVAVAVAALAWRRWREPMLVAVAVAGEVGIFLLVTLMVDRDRPPVRHLDVAPPTSSFPSGHTAATIALWGALAILASERARSALVRGLFLTLAVVLPLLVASSRLYRGMHFPSDVLAGAALGGLWLLATVRGIRIGVAHWALRHGGDGPAGRPWRGSAVRHG